VGALRVGGCVFLLAWRVVLDLVWLCLDLEIELVGEWVVKAVASWMRERVIRDVRLR
jgi:hypothetical protein